MSWVFMYLAKRKEKLSSQTKIRVASMHSRTWASNVHPSLRCMNSLPGSLGLPATNSSSSQNQWIRPKGPTSAPPAVRSVSKAPSQSRSVSPLGSAVPASIYAPDPTPSFELHIPGHHPDQHPDASGLSGDDEAHASLSPQSLSWWSEITTQITYVDYMSEVDMSTPRAILRHPATYKRPYRRVFYIW